MTDRHDSQPLTRRELRERERMAALAGSDPSWRAPQDGPDAKEAEAAVHVAETSTAGDEPQPTPEQPFAPHDTPATSEPEKPGPALSDAPVTSYSEYQKSPAATRDVPTSDSLFAPSGRPSFDRDDDEHTLTRRQLRELRAAEEAQRLAEPGPEASGASTGLLEETDGVDLADGAPAQPDVEPEPIVLEQVDEDFVDDDLLDQQLPATEFITLAEVEPDAVVAEPVTVEPETVVFSAAEVLEAGELASSSGDDVEEADVAEEADVVEEADVPEGTDDPEGSHTRSFHPPTGHWSIAASQKDQPSFEDILSGPADTSGYGAIGSTLVLPTVPSRESAWGAMGKSGEKLETDTVDLPTSLSTTGEHARFDTSALDRMFDEEEVRVDTAMVHAPGSEPVRASSAVSSVTPTGDVVGKAANTSHRLPMALAISAGALAVGVVGLFAAGAILGYF